MTKAVDFGSLSVETADLVNQHVSVASYLDQPIRWASVPAVDHTGAVLLHLPGRPRAP
jgi:hypothetical protein